MNLLEGVIKEFSSNDRFVKINIELVFMKSKLTYYNVSVGVSKSLSKDQLNRER